MKNLLICLLLIVSSQTFAQSKVYNLDKKADSVSYTKTKDIAIYHGETLPVYMSKNGKLFIIVTSKKGNQYKKYIK
jgi:hypothetical protein